MSDEATKELAHAAIGADLARVEKALAAGGDPNGKVWFYADGWSTPTGLAVTSMDREVVLRMLAAGGDLGIEQVRGLPQRALCNQSGTDDFVAWLVHLPQHRALAPLAGGGVTAGTPINVGKLLQDVAGTKKPKVLAVLLDDRYRAVVDSSDLGLALVNAARIDCTESVRLLLAVGAPVGVRDPLSEQTALHWAAQRDNAEIARMLIDAKAGLDVRQRAGYAPLHMAAQVGALKVMSLLLERGAHPVPQNKYEQTPFDMAIEGDSPRAARFLIERGHAKPLEGEALNAAFVNAVKKGNARSMALLAGWGADVDQKVFGRTLMQLAPAQDQEMKRMLRALQTGQRIEEAMPEEEGPRESAPSGGPSPL